jgi:YidC/Oxa1 family membrane protein insertase
MKVMNPEYKAIDTVPFDIWTRKVIGVTVQPEHMEEVPDKIRYLLEHSEDYQDTINKLIGEYVFNVGTSAEVGARYLIDAVFRHIQEKKD